MTAAVPGARASVRYNESSTLTETGACATIMDRACLK